MNIFYDDLTKQITNSEDEEDDDLRQNNFLNLEDVQDKAIIVSTRVFMDEEDKLKKDIIDKCNSFYFSVISIRFLVPIIKSSFDLNLNL